MKTALIIPFHRYPNMSEYYIGLFLNLFLEYADRWKDDIDALYIGDSNGFFTIDRINELLVKQEQSGFTLLPKQTIVISSQNLSHGAHIEHILKEVKEDIVIIADMDTLIFSKGTISRLKKEMIENDYSYYGFVEKDDSGVISRFAPYFGMYQRKILQHGNRPSLDDADADPFTAFTRHARYWNFWIGIVADDRSDLIFNENGLFEHKRTPGDGVYHLRNFMVVPFLLSELKINASAAMKKIGEMPKQELARIAVLHSILIPDNGYFYELQNLIEHAGINLDTWLAYREEAYKFYLYLS